MPDLDAVIKTPKTPYRPFQSRKVAFSAAHQLEKGLVTACA